MATNLIFSFENDYEILKIKRVLFLACTSHTVATTKMCSGEILNQVLSVCLT